MMFLVMMSTLVMIRITGKELRAEEVGLEHKDAEVKVFFLTRSYAALRAADLNWIIGPGYSSGGYILEKNHEKPTWNHKKLWKTNLEP